MESKYLNPDLRSHDFGFSKPIKNINYHNYSERKIWLDFKEGSDSALSYIYCQYVNVLFNFGCHIISDEELVRDCIQDLFMDIIKNRKNLGNVSAIKFYLFKSLRRKIFKILKKERNHPTEEFNDQNEIRFEIICSPETRMINEQLDKEKSIILNTAFEKLTERQREAILLYFYEGFSYKQIAEIMGMGKVKSARVMIYRSIDALQNSLIKVKNQLFLLLLLFINSFL